MRRIFWIALYGISLFGLTACGAVQRPVPGMVYWGTITPRPTVPIVPTPLDYFAKADGKTLTTVSDMRVIDQASERWQARNIADYRLTVSEESAFSRITSYTLTIRGGNVTERSLTCSPPSPARCGDLTEYSVTYILLRARSMVSTGAAPKSSGSTRIVCKPQIAFDPDYGFPRIIHCDDPDVYDEQFTIRVTEFTPLPPQ